MKHLGSWQLRGVLTSLLLVGSAHASVLFFDNFQQFSSGAVLSQTNYVPIVGAAASISWNGDSEGITVVASNFLGSTRAFFEPGSVPYEENNEGDLAIMTQSGVK